MIYSNFDHWNYSNSIRVQLHCEGLIGFEYQTFFQLRQIVWLTLVNWVQLSLINQTLDLVREVINQVYLSPSNGRHLSRVMVYSVYFITYLLLTKFKGRTMGCWPSVRSRLLDIGQVLFLRVYNLARKEWGQYPVILTKQTWSIKDLLYGFGESFSWEIQQVVPGGQDGSVLSARVANHIVQFGSSCPLAELAI